MRGVRLTILSVAVLAGLHLLMLTGSVAGPHRAAPHCLADQTGPGHAGTVMPMAAPVAAPDAASQAVLGATDGCHQPGWHDMAVTCLAILTGLAIAFAVLALTGQRRVPVAGSLRRWVAPVDRPPTPPPIALGISRT